MASRAKFAFFALLVAFGVILAVEANVTGRIVGGYDAKAEEFPYQISLRFNHIHGCGGSIISPNYVLTAAHCVVESGTIPYEAKYFTVRAGTHNRIAGGVIVPVKRVIVHKGYFGHRNDLALLELETPLVYSSSIQPIELADAEVPPGDEVIISGWGLLKTSGDNLPIILQKNNVKALSKSQCSSKIVFYSNTVLCLDHPKGAGACFGDSGGPAIYKGKLVGVCNFVLPSCGSSRPDGYANVFYNLDWIHENMASGAN